MTLDFAFTLTLITLSILLISWIFSAGSRMRTVFKWILSVLIVAVAVITSITVNADAVVLETPFVYVLFAIIAGITAFLVVKAVNPGMKLIFRILFGLLLGIALTSYAFQAFEVAGNSAAIDRANIPDWYNWIQAALWLASAFLFSAAFNPEMNSVMRFLLGLVCALMLISMLWDPILIILSGGL